MANAEKGEVGLEVNGKRYTLRPTFNCLCDLEELTGKTFIEVAEGASRNSAVALRQMIWAYLQECHRDEIKTLSDAGRWIADAGGLGVVSAAIQQLVDRNSEPSEGGKKNPLEAQAGTGASSTSQLVAST